MKKNLTGFTLVEIIISTAIFALVIVSTGSLLFYIQKISLKQRQNLELNEEARWAQTHIMQNIVQCSNLTAITGLDGFNCTINNNTSIVWYWRGDGSTYGSNDTVYYAVNATKAGANSNRQELIGSNFTSGLINNTNNAAVFNVSSGGLLNITMTLCPFSNKTAGAGNPAYRSRMVIRTRN